MDVKSGPTVIVDTVWKQTNVLVSRILPRLYGPLQYGARMLPTWLSHLNLMFRCDGASSHLAGALCFLLTFTSNQDEAGHAYCNLKHINVNISCAHLRAPSSQSYLAQRASVCATNKGANFSFWPAPTENKVWLFLKTVANINTFINGLIFNQRRSFHAESLAVLFCPVPFVSCFSTFLVRVRW